MPLGRRQIFIYWRVTLDDLPDALGALRVWQSDLVRQRPQLRCCIYQRTGTDATEATVMETYALECSLPSPGVDEALLVNIDRSGHALLQRWLRGARKLEVFEALSA